MKLLKSTCLSLAFGFLSLSLVAQEKSDSPLGLSLKLKKGSVWRGIEVNSGIVIDGRLELSTLDNSLSMGVSGVSSVDPQYKEFNYYASFEKSGFSVAIWDIFNYSDGNALDYNINDAFNYNASETGRFVDLELGYKFSDAFPIKLSWATIIFGRDRDVINDEGKKGNKYSTFVHASYPVVQDSKVNLDFGIGGAFAFRNASNSKSNFYGTTYGIVHINLSAHRDVEIGSYKLPISLNAVWNPQKQKTYFEMAFDIIRF